MRAKETAGDYFCRIRFAIEDRLDARWNRDPLARGPTATAAEFPALQREAEAKRYPEVDAVDRELGFEIDPDWLSALALHTQW